MYGQFGYGSQPYLSTGYQSPYSYARQNVNPQMQVQPQSQVQPQIQSAPQIQDIRYGTEEEAKAFIVYPNSSAYFIDEPKGRLYIKTANNMGASSISYFSLTPINEDGTPIKPIEEKPQVDMADYIKKSELQELGFVTMPQLQEILTSLTSQQTKTTPKSTSKSNN